MSHRALRRRAIRLLIVALAVAPGPGCGFGDPDLERAESSLTEGNGRSLNGQKLNGQKLNGQALNDVDLTGVSYSGATSSTGVELGSVTLAATEFTGKVNKKTTITGTAFLGARFIGNTSSGTTLTLRIDSMTKGSSPNEDLWFYGVSYDGSGAWYPLCGVDAAGVAIGAIPVNGRWDLRAGVPGGGSYISDSTAFTFACRDAAIGKCVEAGYKPWKSATGVKSLQDHLTACTRLLRADFCGDGTSWTTDGRLVEIYDGVGIQLDTEPTWSFEASWTADGASCVRSERYFDTGQGIAPCYLSLFDLQCGSEPFSKSVLLKNRFAEFMFAMSGSWSQ